MRTHELSRPLYDSWSPRMMMAMSNEELFEKSTRFADEEERLGTRVRRAAFERATGRLVAMVSLNEIVRGPFQNAYVGWRTSADALGLGYAPEAVRALIALALTDPPLGLGLHRVQANIMPTNAASLRVAEKLGLRREGLALRYLEINGVYADHVMYAMTREEWLHPSEVRLEPVCT
jgi:ribosomal-protein-alanine N-acetyltransferase